ncbi:hypothetical protein [Pseudomonas aeruginosa]|uniref:hypothetical protein n=1 Tax=Pseudomonas aeruginosa TaxID=287 RepID=UPI000DFFE881|nr:hypothetical protein [Pseudomonas aeruginosa]SUG12446.1 Uncharacterised protein [Pseudomonas aeruginosa]
MIEQDPESVELPPLTDAELFALVHRLSNVTEIATRFFPAVGERRSRRSAGAEGVPVTTNRKEPAP